MISAASFFPIDNVQAVPFLTSFFVYSLRVKSVCQRLRGKLTVVWCGVVRWYLPSPSVQWPPRPFPASGLAFFSVWLVLGHIHLTETNEMKRSDLPTATQESIGRVRNKT